MKPRTGITIIEVLIALILIGVVMALLSISLVNSLQLNRSSGQRSQAALVLDNLGQQVTRGNAAALPETNETERSWDYGQLTAVLTTFSGRGSFADPELYKAKVSEAGEVELAEATREQYLIEVCWEEPGNEFCIDGVAVSQ